MACTHLLRDPEEQHGEVEERGPEGRDAVGVVHRQQRREQLRRQPKGLVPAHLAPRTPAPALHVGF